MLRSSTSARDRLSGGIEPRSFRATAQGIADGARANSQTASPETQGKTSGRLSARKKR
jgi:hypothetical protein